MHVPSPETIWQLSDNELLSLLDSGALIDSKRIHFYAPSFMHYKTSRYRSSSNFFPTISVTEGMCTLQCKHCEGRVLQTMHQANTPEKLYLLSLKLKKNGATGLLISGGCRKDGSVPIDRFIPTIEKIKHQLSLTVFVHTGIIDYDTARALKNAGVDAALIDIIGSNETISEVLMLDATTEDYQNSLKALHEAELDFVPHIVAGLHNGKIKGELDALRIIASNNPSAIVIIALMPIHGTVMAEIAPPQPIEVARVLASARVMFPKKSLILGCMRPKGKFRSELDTLAIKSGVNAIAFPDESAIIYAQKEQYESSFSEYCCAQAFLDAKQE